MLKTLFVKVLNNEYDLVVSYSEEFNEIYTYIVEKKTGLIHQDLSIVRPVEDKVEVLVYSDCDNEDYTHKFKIDIWDGEV